MSGRTLEEEEEVGKQPGRKEVLGEPRQKKEIHTLLSSPLRPGDVLAASASSPVQPSPSRLTLTPQVLPYS